MAETFSGTDMLPNKFEPKRSYRWVNKYNKKIQTNITSRN